MLARQAPADSISLCAMWFCPLKHFKTCDGTPSIKAVLELLEVFMDFSGASCAEKLGLAEWHNNGWWRLRIKNIMKVEEDAMNDFCVTMLVLCVFKVVICVEVKLPDTTVWVIWVERLEMEVTRLEVELEERKGEVERRQGEVGGRDERSFGNSAEHAEEMGFRCSWTMMGNVILFPA